MYWKTITTYLVNWNPTWIKTVELSNWIWKAIIIPRAKLKEAKWRLETLQPAVYFLFWNDEEDKNTSYIWEAENLINRIGNHDSNKDFWDTVIAFISKDNNLTKADVKYLEARAIEQAKKTNRFSLLNSIEPIPNNLPEYQQACMDEFLENIDLLISAVGYPILKKISNEKNIHTWENIYFLNARNSQWKWVYTEDWFLVLKWSKGPNSIVESMIRDKWYAVRHRPRLIEKWIIIDDGKNIVFQEDYLFKSPSSAGMCIAWRSINWWLSWKNKDWKTLDEVERKELID